METDGFVVVTNCFSIEVKFSENILILSSKLFFINKPSPACVVVVVRTILVSISIGDETAVVVVRTILVSVSIDETAVVVVRTILVSISIGDETAVVVIVSSIFRYNNSYFVKSK